LGNQFADKDTFRKKIFALEKNIKNLYDLMMAANAGKKDNEDDAMFTRKPLGPVSCASCDKGIVNLIGQQADYLAWKKLPFREPNERIAKYGQGFSKILGMMKSSDADIDHVGYASTGFNNTMPAQYATHYANTGSQELPSMSPNKAMGNRSGSMDMHGSSEPTAAGSMGAGSKIGGA